MIFAAEVQEVLPVAAQGWIALIVQTGAIGILGYHLLVSLPKMVKDMTATVMAALQMFQQAQIGSEERTSKRADDDRKAFYERSQAIIAAFHARGQEMINELTKLGDKLPVEVGPKIDSMLKELSHQSESMDVHTEMMQRQTESVDNMSAKLDKWPSDTERICKAKEAMGEAGIDPKTIERFIAVMQRRKGASK